jgi:transitional endoplasmic reticulum ATPase
MEDSIISLFTYAIAVVQKQHRQQQYFGQKCIIILDDIDKLFALLSTKDDEFIGNDDSNNSTSRCKALFVSILDIIHDKCTSSSSSSNSLVADDMNNDNDDSGHLLLICTAGSHCVEVVDRFDRIFTLDRWEEDVHHHHQQQHQKQQRRQMILSCLSSDTSLNINDNVSNGIDAMVSRIVHHTIGKRVCELAQICREVLLRDIIEEQQQQQQSIITHSNDAVVVVKRRLQCLDNILQTITPQSIRGGNLDGVVDVRVVTPKELQSLLVPYTVDGTVHLPLLGIEAKRAYDELMNIIVIPLCRSDEIHALLYDGGGGGDHDNATRSTSTMRVGALLAGNPGVGKTTLAYYCAAMAATMMSTNNRGVTLLDVSATSLIHKEIGSSERAVHSLFVAVRAAAPCILLIDGIDSVALRRGNDNTTEGTMDRVLSTFLTELDGIEEMEYSGGNVAVIGITHHPNLIDPALLRPGRLEKVITLGGLDYEARKKIVLRQIEDCAFDFTTSSSSMDDYSFNNNIKNKNDIANFVAYQTTNMSAVEVIAICREASMVCLRELNFDTQVKPSLTYNHFQRAIVIMKGKSS